jgi:hypothetical protein
MRQNFLTRRRAVWVDAMARSPLFPRSSLSDPRKVASARFPASTQATGSLAAFFRGLKTAHPAGNDCTDGRCVSIDEGCGCRKRRHRVLRFLRVISIAKHGAARGLGCKLPSPRVKQNTAQRHNSLSGGGVIHIEPALFWLVQNKMLKSKPRDKEHLVDRYGSTLTEPVRLAAFGRKASRFRVRKQVS